MNGASQQKFVVVMQMKTMWKYESVEMVRNTNSGESIIQHRKNPVSPQHQTSNLKL